MKFNLNLFCTYTLFSFANVLVMPFGINWLGFQEQLLATSSQQKYPKDTASTCGRQLVRKSKIVNGEDSYNGEFPWMVSLQHKNGHICGGAIIASQWIITAAHCFIDPVRNQEKDAYKIMAGINTLSNTPYSDALVIKNVENIVMHEHFSAKSFVNDIALIKLSEPIIWDEYKQPVCLPNSGIENRQSEDVIVTGWGRNQELEYGGKLSDILQKVTVKVVNRVECANWYREAGFPHTFQNGHLCAGFKEGGKDSCTGDSGGPMVIKRDDYFQIIGVVSSGIGCARPLLPGLYTDVENYLPWIKSKMRN